MNAASLFNLAGPDLIVILLIVLLLFGAKRLPPLAREIGKALREFMEARRRWMGNEAQSEESRKSPIVIFNRLLVPIAIVIFLMACGVWLFGNSR